MMKLIDLYNRILETTGLEVMTLGSLEASCKNCFADLTSRGYKEYKELTLKDFLSKDEDVNAKINGNMLILTIPEGVSISETLSLKLYFNESCGVKAIRYSLTNKRLGARYFNGEFRSIVPEKSAIFYIKNNKIYIEWDTSFGYNIKNLVYSYYSRLTCPSFPTDEEFKNNENALKDVVIDIKKEFEDALVFYGAYFYYSRYQKDTDKIQLYLNQYKYFIEDITHELAYEDIYNEEDACIKIEEDEYE